MESIIAVCQRAWELYVAIDQGAYLSSSGPDHVSVCTEFEFWVTTDDWGLVPSPHGLRAVFERRALPSVHGPMRLAPGSWLAADMALHGDHGQCDPAYEALCDQLQSEEYPF